MNIILNAIRRPDLLEEHKRQLKEAFQTPLDECIEQVKKVQFYLHQTRTVFISEMKDTYDMPPDVANTFAGLCDIPDFTELEILQMEEISKYSEEQMDAKFDEINTTALYLNVLEEILDPEEEKSFLDTDDNEDDEPTVKPVLH